MNFSHSELITLFSFFMGVKILGFTTKKTALCAVPASVTSVNTGFSHKQMHIIASIQAPELKNMP